MFKVGSIYIFNFDIEAHTVFQKFLSAQYGTEFEFDKQEKYTRDNRKFSIEQISIKGTYNVIKNPSVSKISVRLLRFLDRCI